MKLTIPILIEAILHMMLGFVDVFMLSRYNDLAASGVNAANQVITSMVFLVFSGSAGILISQYLGAGQKENASRAAALALTLHLVSGLLISLLVFLFSGPMLRFIGAEEKAFEFASDYLTLVGVFLFLQSLYSAMSVIIRSHGLTKQPMIFATVMNILNAFLNTSAVPGHGRKGRRPGHRHRPRGRRRGDGVLPVHKGRKALLLPFAQALSRPGTEAGIQAGHSRRCGNLPLPAVPADHYFPGSVVPFGK